MDRDRPERPVVEVAQVLVLALGRPRRVDVGDVVERPDRLGLERPRRPHAGERPPVEAGRGRHRNRLAFRDRDDVVALNEVGELLELLLRHRDELPGRRMIFLGFRPGGQRIAAVHA